MTRRLIAAVSIASLLAGSSISQLVAQTPATSQGAKGQLIPPGTDRVTSPCVGAPKSPECAFYRLDGIDRRLSGIDESLRQLDSALRALNSRPGLATIGPPIAQPDDPGDKADASGDYIQKRLDSLTKTVSELVIRVNAATSTK